MFNRAADLTYGFIYFLCFLIGTLGNIASFLYFKSKRRDISNVIYKMITVNDIVVSLTTLPVGLSLLEKRNPGLFLGNWYGCAVWTYLWYITISFSVFLVICLSTTRTMSLLRPFRKQKIRHLVIAVVLYLSLQLALNIWFHVQEVTEIKFSPDDTRCNFRFTNSNSSSAAAVLHTLVICDNVFFVAPVFTIAASCIISAGLLTRRKLHVEQRELQRSRNRATVSIILFALVYIVCNVPLVVDFFYTTIAMSREWNYDLYKFDTQSYYYNTATTLLPAANSAVNPLLYFWRMPPLRQSTLAKIRRLLRLNSQTRRSNVVEAGCAGQLVLNISAVQLGATVDKTIETNL